MRTQCERMWLLRDRIKEVGIQVDQNTAQLADMNMTAKDFTPGLIQTQYDPDLHEIIGVCKMSEKPCMMC